jgi:hypothetical protein
MTMLHKPRRPPFELTGIGLRYRLWTLDIGESVTLKLSKPLTGQLSGIWRAFAPKRFETRKTNEGLRVERIE